VRSKIVRQTSSPPRRALRQLEIGPAVLTFAHGSRFHPQGRGLIGFAYRISTTRRALCGAGSVEVEWAGFYAMRVGRARSLVSGTRRDSV
jgi:hypothetical protein